MDCVFCKIIAGETPTTYEYQDEFCVAFRDIHPTAPVHVLVVPKQHVASLVEVNSDLLGQFLLTVGKVAQKLGIMDGFQVVVNSGNLQEVPHLYFHLKGGMK